MVLPLKFSQFKGRRLLCSDATSHERKQYDLMKKDIITIVSIEPRPEFRAITRNELG